MSKIACTIPCSSDFRDRVEALAAIRGVNVADIARSVMLTVPEADLRRAPDPGGPGPDDRETVTLRTGRSAGREMRRKPRLQLRLPAAADPALIRKALKIALDLADGNADLALRLPGDAPPPPPGPGPEEQRLAEENRTLRDQIDRLRSIVGVLSQDVPPDGVASARDALHVLGFAPGANPGKAEIRARFRMLATVHHPDGELGSHERMSLLNQAVGTLLKR
jgi:hypothetical protein